MTRYASYVRTSTEHQESGAESQTGSIEEWFEREDVEEWEQFVDLEQSGADDSRQQFSELVAAVRADEYDHVVMAEISRVSRKTATAADFIDALVETNTRAHLLNDMIDVIDPEQPMTAFFAKQISLLNERTREQAVRRSIRGQKHAAKEGKWIGTTPKGFTTNSNGYLVVDHPEYFALVDALERIDDGESYRSVADETDFNRVTLMDIYKDEERRAWYLEGEASDDDRVDEALDQLQTSD